MTQVETPRLPYEGDPLVIARAKACANERIRLDKVIQDAQVALDRLRYEERQLDLVRSIAFFEHFQQHNDIPVEHLLDAERSDVYRRYQDLGRFPGVYAPGAYRVDTNQRTLNLMMHRARVGEVQAASRVLRFLLPHFKSDEAGLVSLRIFSGDNCRWVACFDCVSHDQCFVGLPSRSGSMVSSARFESIEDLLCFVQEHHPYSDDEKSVD